MPDYSIAFLFDSIYVDAPSIEKIRGYPPFKKHVDLVDALQAAGRLRAVDYNDIINPYQQMIKISVEHDMKDMEFWLRPFEEAVDLWGRFAEAFIASTRKSHEVVRRAVFSEELMPVIVGGMINGLNKRLTQRTYKIGPCKNAAAYRTVLLADSEGREALRMLRSFLKGRQDPNSLVFHSKRGSPLRETNVLHAFLHSVLKALVFPQAGNARVSLWLQSEVGVVRDESCCSSSANGTQLRCDDGKIYRRNSTRTGERPFPLGNWKIWKTAGLYEQSLSCV